MRKQCSTVASSRIKKIYAVIEENTGTLQRPTPESYIKPAGDPSITQTPTYTDSEELTGTLDVIDQFKNAVEAGESSVPMYVSMDKNGTMQGHDLFAAFMGNVQERNIVSAKVAAQDITIPAGIDARSTVIPYDGASGEFPDSGTILIDSEKISYSSKDGNEFKNCVRAQESTLAASHNDDALITLTVTANVNSVAGIDDSVTSIPYDGASGKFPDSGTIMIGDEKISYSSKTETELQGCTRGFESTSAAAHDDDSVITLTVTATLNKPESVLSGSIPSSETTIPVADIAGGFMPRRGVVTIGAEKIRYIDVQEDNSGNVTALLGCTRGFDGTTAAEIADEEDLTLNSLVFFWDNCRPTVSLWMQVDHSVFFARGAKVTQCQIPMSKTGGQHADFTFNFAQMGWVGRSFLKSAPVGAVLSVKTEDGADAWGGYCVGGIIKNHTKNDDNSGNGYTITAVDEERGTITVAPTPSGWSEGDRIDPWLPVGKEHGKPLESASMRAFVGGKAGKLTEGSITLGAPTAYTSEIGDEFPGESADNMRQLTMDNGLYFRAKDIVEFKRGYDGYDMRVDVVMGNKAGTTLALAMPRVRFQMPTMATEEPFVTLTRTGAIMGTKGNDSVYIIQE